MKASDRRPFHFKQFSLFQDRCAMKIGTDGVLLGAWACVEDQLAGRVLDIGTGTGLISLMLVQRNGTLRVDAIELDAAAASQAAENVAESPFCDAIHVYHTAVQMWKPEAGYDHIVSNPPFYKSKIKSPIHSRARARHDDMLPLKDLVGGVARLLATDGRFSVVWPADREGELAELLDSSGLRLARRCEVYPTPDKSYHRLLMTWDRSSEPATTHSETLTIEQYGRGGYAPQFLQMLKAYYRDM